MDERSRLLRAIDRTIDIVLDEDYEEEGNLWPLCVTSGGCPGCPAHRAFDLCTGFDIDHQVIVLGVIRAWVESEL